MSEEINSSADNQTLTFTSRYLKFEDEKTKKERQISYYKVEGTSRPGVVFIPGFMAHKDHKKSLEVLKFCSLNEIPCVSYDTAGYGESTRDITKQEARFTHWLQDAKEVLLNLTEGPQVVIGSSMGGWLGMILAQELPHIFSGLILLAPAYNFGERILQEVVPRFPAEIQRRMREEGFVVERVDPKFPDYGEVPISFAFFEGLIPFNLLLDEDAIKVDIPVRLIHGTKDEVFPPSRSEGLISALSSNDVTLQILKGCKHELSDQRGLEAIVVALIELRKLASLDRSH